MGSTLQWIGADVTPVAGGICIESTALFAIVYVQRGVDFFDVPPQSCGLMENSSATLTRSLPQPRVPQPQKAQFPAVTLEYRRETSSQPPSTSCETWPR